MATEVLMPQMGADMTEGTVLRWLIAPGDDVRRGQPIAEIETDKANVEIEAFEDGVFLRPIAKEGDVVPVGEPIGLIGSRDELQSGAGEAAPSESRREAAVQAAPENPAQVRQAGQQALSVQGPGREEGRAAPHRGGAVSFRPPEATDGRERRTDGRVRASPVARRMAEEWGIDLAGIAGTGPEGRIVRRDVEAAAREARPRTEAAAAPPAPVRRPEPTPTQAEAELRPLSRIRQTIARRMTASKRDVPHYYVTLDVDMSEAMDLRRRLNASEEGVRITVNDLVVKATAIALERHPEFNALFSEGGITIRPRINVCIAIALDEGLIAPAILDTNLKPLRTISEEARDLAERARSGRLSPDEYGAGTFTISNLGMFGIDTLLAVIQPGQSAILGVGQVAPRAVVVDGEIVARQMMTLGLAADHRSTDGAQGAQFLQALRDILEHPYRLVV